MLFAIGLIVASTLSFAICDIAAKLMQTEASADRITWWRYVVYIAVAVPLAAWRMGWRSLTPFAPGLQILRGVCAVGSTALFVYGLHYLEVPETTSIAFMSPIFVMALSIVFLGEVVGIRRWISALISFAGVLLVVRPGTSGFEIAALLPMASALSGAFATVITRRLLVDSAETTMLWTAVIGFAITTAMMAPGWSMPSLYEVACGLVTGGGFAVGQVLVIVAYRTAPVSVLAPFSYVQLLSAGVLSFAFFGVLPSLWTLAGMSLIAMSGIYTAHREHVRTQQRNG